MQVPVLLMNCPGGTFWLTDERAVSPSERPVLIDASGRVHHPTDLAPGPILVKEGTCSYEFYEAAQRRGYQVVWIE
jgi:hypothetical protein